MAAQLLFATFMVILTAVVHLVGLGLLTRVLRSHSRLMRRMRILPLTLLLIASIGIIGIHTAEIWIWAAIYLKLETFRNFEQALYFSTVTYASVGYGDLLLPKAWRIFGAIEGAAGIIMLGLSTAYLVSLLTRVKLFAHDWLVPEDGSQ
jgi:voltage-gated potassium channel